MYNKQLLKMITTDNILMPHIVELTLGMSYVNSKIQMHMPDTLSLLMLYMKMKHLPSLAWLMWHTLDEKKNLLLHANEDYVHYVLGQVSVYWKDFNLIVASDQASFLQGMFNLAMKVVMLSKGLDKDIKIWLDNIAITIYSGRHGVV